MCLLECVRHRRGDPATPSSVTYEGQDAKGLNGYGHYHEVAGRWLIATLRLTRLRLEPLPGGSPDA